MSLTQGQTTGNGVGVEACAGGLVHVPVVVPAHGPNSFQPGAATANLEEIVREKGVVTEHQFWTRAVVLAPSP